MGQRSMQIPGNAVDTIRPARPNIADESHLLQMIIAFVLAGLIFVVDLLVPRGVADSVLYIVPVLLVSRSRSTTGTLATAGFCSLLILIGSLYSPFGAVWKVVVNRGLSLFAMWVTAVLALQWQRLHRLEIDRTTAQADQALRESEERFHRIVESVEDYAILMLDLDGSVASWNSGAQRITGYTEDEIISRHFSQFYTPEDAAAGMPQRALAIAAQEGRFVSEGWRVRKDGTRFMASVLISALRDDDGTLRGYAKVTHDITQRRQAEQALRRAERLASLGTMAAGIAHEINNPLGAAWSSAQAAMNVKDDPELHALLGKCIDNIVNSVKRCRQIVDNVMKFARPDVADRRPISINHVVRSAVDISLDHAQRHGARLEVNLSPSLPDATLHDVQVQQVLLNLIQNAVESGNPVTVRIATYYRDDSVCISVEDDGRGMTTEEVQRAFDPFYTSGKIGGIGLGMSIAHGIVESHGGTIEIESELGRGTLVAVRLPASRESAKIA